MFKIGKELFTRFGPEVVSLVHSLGAEVFLDLKYHDIPNTVRGASYAAAELGVYMFNVHASGCSEMLEAAVTGAKDAVNYLGVRMPKVIGVTLLTSIDQKQLNGELGVNGTVSEYVMRLAKMSEQVGLDGIVCSAADLSSIKSELSDGFVYVTPGIKGVDGAVGSDQRRVMTPGNALQDGSSVLVIGRAITGYASPDERKMAAYKVLEDMAKYM